MLKKRMIYQKPLTEEDPEGMAYLHKKIDSFGELDTWEVHFVRDPAEAHYTRRIKTSAVERSEE